MNVNASVRNGQKADHKKSDRLRLIKTEKNVKAKNIFLKQLKALIMKRSIFQSSVIPAYYLTRTLVDLGCFCRYSVTMCDINDAIS